MLYSRNNLFDEFFNSYNPVKGFPTDIIEEDQSYRLEIEVPGYSKEELSISLERGNLTIEANKSVQPDFKYIHKEREDRTASRTFYIGDYLTVEDIKASFNNGILSITVPKYEVKKIENRKAISID